MLKTWTTTSWPKTAKKWRFVGLYCLPQSVDFVADRMKDVMQLVLILMLSLIHTGVVKLSPSSVAPVYLTGDQLARAEMRDRPQMGIY